MNTTFLDFPLFDVPEPAGAARRCRGANREQTIVLYQAGEAAAPPLEEFLGKVLGALSLDLARDVALLRLAPGERLAWSRLRAFVPARRFIAFGISPAQAGIRLTAPRYHPLFHGGVTYLFADDLAAIHEERQQGGRERSGALWQALQEMFPKAK